MPKNKFLSILLVFILVFVYLSFFSPGARVANDFPLVSKESIKESFGLPYAWTKADNFGEYAVSTLWAYPLDFLFGLGAYLGIDFDLLERILGFFPFLVIGIWACKKLFYEYKFSSLGKFAGSLFYLLNTYIILVIDGGQFRVALSYSLFPFVFLSFKKAYSGGFQKKLIAGLALSILGFFDIRFVFILFVLLALDFFYWALFLRKGELVEYLLNWVKVGFCATIVFLGLHFYWILPAFLVKAPSLPPTYQRASQVGFLSFANIAHSLLLLSPHWYKNVFGKVAAIDWKFFLIPVLVFLAPILRKKDRLVGFWLLVSVIAVFLVKGSNPPFSGVYTWVFENLPGFFIFRDPTKFFILICLSYSLLLGITLDEISKKLAKLKFKNKFFKFYLSNSWLLAIFLTSYLLLLASPVWLGKMTGTLSQPNVDSQFIKLKNLLSQDKSYGKVFWIPSRPPLGISYPNHPAIDALRFAEVRPFASGTVGTYEILNFLREGAFMGEIFDVLGIKYIAYPFPDTRREDLKKDNIDYYYTFLDQLSNLSWIEGKLTEPPLSLLKTKNSQDKFFIADNTFLVVGSDGIYNELVKIDNFKLSKNALIFAEEKPATSTLCEEIPCRILLYEKGKIDLAASFIDQSDFIFPAKNLGFSPKIALGTSWLSKSFFSDNTGRTDTPSLGGWWKRETSDFVWFRNFLHEKYGIENLDFDYGGGWAIAEGERLLGIDNQKLSSGKILLARVMQSSKGGKLEFYQKDEKIGEIDTKIEKPQKVNLKLTGYKETPDKIFEYDKANFNWFEVGELTLNAQSLTIKTTGSINVVNALAIVDKDKWNRLLSKTGDSNNRLEILEWEKLSENDKSLLFAKNNFADLTYEKINPTKYRIKLEGISNPVSLVFSETFDPFWEIKNLATGEKSSSYPVYSLINGFRLEKEGTYEVYFYPQKYVYLGLVASTTSLLAILFLLNISRFK